MNKSPVGGEGGGGGVFHDPEVDGNGKANTIINNITSSIDQNMKPIISSGGIGSGSGLVTKKKMNIVRMTLLFVGMTVACFIFYNSVFPSRFLPISLYDYTGTTYSQGNEHLLDAVLKNASMKDRTILVTTLNDAWAEPNSIFDLFLESFHIGSNTKWLLNHLVVICLDQKAYARCLALHPHCYELYTQGANFTSEASFMSSDYLQMMWRRIQFMSKLLERGYNFVFTDTDIMWLRNPFPRFYPDADFQIACDFFKGDSYSIRNLPNGGFTYVKSNKRTIWFYKFWYFSRKAYPKMHDQDVLNKIKSDRLISDYGLKMRFLDTRYFGGFCQPSKDFNKVCTMHANCCVGLDNKVNDLRILLQVWRKFMSLPPNDTTTAQTSWTVPRNCSTSFQRLGKHS
ncbi:uncharacterized protein At4g15970-like isoform X1 [Prunus dulcis]|uniref:uncharacterized protein At4g15970-like isoform X1 n=1 Tax=Prunus dulcis TaxID=3755 RepID=UPI001482AC1D|nr:uncharacterized protein At4g15970-like isoform X1 [Prunus dulcis]